MVKRLLWYLTYPVTPVRSLLVDFYLHMNQAGSHRPPFLSAYPGQAFDPNLTHFYPHRPVAFSKIFSIFICILPQGVQCTFRGPINGLNWHSRSHKSTLQGFQQQYTISGSHQHNSSITNQLCRISFNISAWTDTTVASQISSEGFVSIYGLNWHNSKALLTSCRFYKQQQWVIKLNTWTDLVFVQRVEQNGLR